MYKKEVKHEVKTATTTFTSEDTLTGIKSLMLTPNFEQNVIFTLKVFGVHKRAMHDEDCKYKVSCDEEVKQCYTKITSASDFDGLWRLEKGCAKKSVLVSELRKDFIAKHC